MLEVESIMPEIYQIPNSSDVTRAAVRADIDRVQRELPQHRVVAMLRGLRKLQESEFRDRASFSLLNLVDTTNRRARFRGKEGSIIEPMI